MSNRLFQWVLRAIWQRHKKGIIIVVSLAFFASCVAILLHLAYWGRVIEDSWGLVEGLSGGTKVSLAFGAFVPVIFWFFKWIFSRVKPSFWKGVIQPGLSTLGVYVVVITFYAIFLAQPHTYQKKEDEAKAVILQNTNQAKLITSLSGETNRQGQEIVGLQSEAGRLKRMGGEDMADRLKQSNETQASLREDLNKANKANDDLTLASYKLEELRARVKEMARPIEEIPLTNRAQGDLQTIRAQQHRRDAQQRAEKELADAEAERAKDAKFRNLLSAIDYCVKTLTNRLATEWAVGDKIECDFKPLPQTPPSKSVIVATVRLTANSNWNFSMSLAQAQGELRSIPTGLTSSIHNMGTDLIVTFSGDGWSKRTRPNGISVDIDELLSRFIGAHDKAFPFHPNK